MWVCIFTPSRHPYHRSFLLFFTLPFPSTISAKKAFFPSHYKWVVTLHSWHLLQFTKLVARQFVRCLRAALTLKILTTKCVKHDCALTKGKYNLLCIYLQPHFLLMQILKSTLFCPVPDTHTDFILEFLWPLCISVVAFKNSLCSEFANICSLVLGTDRFLCMINRKKKKLALSYQVSVSLLFFNLAWSRLNWHEIA